jgi:signal transduction histidine kinase/DNA-binding NarL/FixJ family response regulator
MDLDRSNFATSSQEEGSMARSAFILLSLCLGFMVGACGGSYSGREAPKAVDGILDLSHWDFDRDGPLKLDGVWNFQWDRFLEPEDLAARTDDVTPSSLRVPGAWTPSQKSPDVSQGYGTAWLRIRGLSLHMQSYALLIPQIGTAYRAALFRPENAEAAAWSWQAGKPGDSKSETVPELLPQINSFQHTQDGDLILLVQLASYHHRSGGLWRSMELGRSEVVTTRFRNVKVQEIAVVAMILMIGFYNFGIFLQRREDGSSLWLAAYCMVIALREFCTSDLISFVFVPGSLWTYELRFKMEYMTLLGNAACLAMFLSHCFPAFIRRKGALVCLAVAGVSIVLVTLFEAAFYTRLLRVFQFLLLSIEIYLFYGWVKAVLKNAESARLSFAGCLIISFAVVYDVLVNMNILNTGYIYGMGVTVFLLVQSLVIGQKFAAAFRRSEWLVQELKEQEKARTLFFHNTSHELRTPLNGILGFVDLLRQERYGVLPPKALQQIEKIGSLSQSLMDQVNTILDLAKSRRGDLVLHNSQIPLDELVEEVRNMCEGLLVKHPQVSFTWKVSWSPQDKASFTNDREKLLRIIRNLLGNAFKFSKAAEANRVGLALALDTTRKQLEIQVSDQGIGIAPDHHEAIFQEFFQVQSHARRAYEGTGLGLAMVRKIVSLMGGTIQLDSAPGEGSVFTVRIPSQASVPLQSLEPRESAHGLQIMRVDDFHAAAGTPPKSRPLKQQSARILVIDDNPINCEVISDILSSSGYAIDIASGGQEGLDAIKRQHPDLVLLDLMMPNVSGEDVLQHLKSNEEYKDIPVILLTARASQEDRIHGLNLGADDYLAKPIISDEMSLRVYNTISRLNFAREAAQKVILIDALNAAQQVHESLGRERRQMPGVQLSEYYHAAESASGDWLGVHYDAGHNRLYMMIGDVTGHGMISALVTVAVAGAVHGAISMVEKWGSERSMEESLRAIAGSVNKAVCDSGGRVERWMTMAFIGLDMAKGEGLLLNAGHGPIYQLNSQKSRPLQALGSCLGSTDRPEFGLLPFKLDAGDGLFLFTDGLIENKGQGGHGMNRRELQNLLNASLAPDELRQHIVEKVQTYWGEAPLQDDVSFLILQWTG